MLRRLTELLASVVRLAALRLVPTAARQGRDSEAVVVGSADVAFIKVAALALNRGLRRRVLRMSTAMRRGPVERATI